MYRFLLLSLLLLACSDADHADHAESPTPGESGLHAQHDAHAAGSSYADETGRTIAALSASDVQSLLEGRGMGLARAAELNSYPGPMHALELAQDLDLTAEQTAKVQSLMDRVKASARAIGRTIVDEETALDQAFASGRATVQRVDQSTARIAQLSGQLRAAHLNAHVAMRGVLTAEQIARYDTLRGYSD